MVVASVAARGSLAPPGRTVTVPAPGFSFYLHVNGHVRVMSSSATILFRHRKETRRRWQDLRTTVLVWREGEWWVILEPITGVASQGRTREDALENIGEALGLYLEESPAVKPYRLADVGVEEIQL